MPLVVPILLLEIGVHKRREEGSRSLHAVSQIPQRSARLFDVSAENEDAVGSVQRYFLFEVHDVGVHDARYRRGTEDPACALGCAVLVGEIQWVLGRVLGAPVDGVGAVRYAVAGGEFTRCLERLDEVVICGLVGRRACDFACGRDARGKEFGVAGVEIEEGFGDELAFGFVGFEHGALHPAGFDVVDFPGEVHSVKEGGIHALSGFGGVRVACVATHEDALVEGVAFCDALADGIDGVPFYAVPGDGVWFEDFLGEALGFFCGYGFAGVPVWVAGAGDLNI